MTKFVVEEELEKVKDKETQKLLEEVISCYSNGNYRATIVTLYTTMIYNLLSKINVLSNYYDIPQAKDLIAEISTKKNHAPKSPQWEDTLLQGIKRIHLVSNEEYDELQNLKINRNYAAHPIVSLKADNTIDDYEMKSISRETAADMIRKAFEIVFLRDPVIAININEKIEKDIKNGYVSVLKIDGTIVATGCFVDDHITRVYVLPEHQKKGYGTFIMKNIEEQIGEKFDKAYLDASLPVAALYEKLGFVNVMHERYPVENGVILVYEVMEKELHKISTDINYDGRKFIPKMNSENGEVGEQTNFTYHQNGNLLWDEYSGGDILKGSLIGSVLCNGELDFVYHHMNQNMQIKTGKCHSVPTVQENGKIELSEKWQWTSGDYSKGESLLVEV